MPTGLLLVTSVGLLQRQLIQPGQLRKKLGSLSRLCQNVAHAMRGKRLFSLHCRTAVAAVALKILTHASM